MNMSLSSSNKRPEKKSTFDRTSPFADTDVSICSHRDNSKREASKWTCWSRAFGLESFGLASDFTLRMADFGFNRTETF